MTGVTTDAVEVEMSTATAGRQALQPSDYPARYRHKFMKSWG